MMNSNSLIILLVIVLCLTFHANARYMKEGEFTNADTEKIVRKIGSKSSTPTDKYNLFGSANDNIDASINHEYYDLEIRMHNNYTSGFVDISQTGTAFNSVSNTDDSPPYGSIVLSDGDYFQFYGHGHTTLYIDANGFVSFYPTFCVADAGVVGFCNWMFADPTDSFYVRYIAPFMTDFDPSASDMSKIYYQVDTDSVLNMRRVIIQWDHMVLHSSMPCDMDTESFTFQVIMYENGDIAMNYKDIPFNPMEHHLNGDPLLPVYPLTIGLSDEADVNGWLETYHPVPLTYNQVYNTLDNTNIYNESIGSSIYLRARETCLDFTECYSCINFTLANENRTNSLQCGWCPQSNICTDTFGREQNTISDACVATSVSSLDYSMCLWQEPISAETNSGVVMETVAYSLLGIASLALIIYVGIKLNDRRLLIRKTGDPTGYSQGVENSDYFNRPVGLESEMSVIETNDVILHEEQPVR